MAATHAAMAWTAKTTRPPRIWVKEARSAATSRLGAYTKSSCWNGGVGWSTIGSAGGEPVPGRGPYPWSRVCGRSAGTASPTSWGARPRVSVAVGWGSAVHGGSYGGKAVAVALANLAAAVNVGLFLLAFRVLTPRQIPTRQLVAGAAGRWGGLAGPAGRRWLPGRPLSASHQPGVRGVRDRPWPAVLVVSGRAAHLVRRRSQCCGRPAALAAKPAATTIGQHQRIRRSG
jgi:hypothetical protein